MRLIDEVAQEVSALFDIESADVQRAHRWAEARRSPARRSGWNGLAGPPTPARLEVGMQAAPRVVAEQFGGHHAC